MPKVCGFAPSGWGRSHRRWPREGFGTLSDWRHEILAPAASATTPYDWLIRNAVDCPRSPAFGHWHDGGVDGLYTFPQLLDQVHKAGAGLKKEGVGPQDRVLLSLPNGVGFVVGLLACLGLAAIPVPAPVPSLGRPEAFRERLLRITADCRPTLVITSADWMQQVEGVVGDAEFGVRVVDVESLPERSDAPFERRPAGPVALLQYTSGSTTRPRGVMVTSQNLHESCQQAAKRYGEGPTDSVITWVPLYHDMGLITGLMRPLFSGYPSYFMSPQEFVRRPATWLEAISACGATLGSAPNFAYDYCVRKISKEQAARLDLRSWRIARNASEVVRPETVQRFTECFAAAGLRQSAMSPSYGLAEATLAVTASAPDVPAARITVDRSALQAGRVVQVTGSAPDSEASVSLISSGTPVADTHLRIVPDVAGSDVGEIHVRGPQISPGYWSMESGQHASGEHRWLETGDLGFLCEGQLFVLGRKDDTLIIRGRNHHSADITTVCGALPGVRHGRIAAFAGPGRVHDGVGVVLEVTRDFERSEPDWARLAASVTEALARRLELGVQFVGLVGPGQLPVTTSGKVRSSEVGRRVVAGRMSFLFQWQAPTGGLVS
ncbi:fatty acyl-AMP ligase [Streptomyces sp. NPDC021225]|uniref:fatty acyl-AMP ligase n=1 Tax=Streptomyces sp. NPDC021225 TaxID=3365121 RepID=UPI00379EB621